MNYHLVECPGCGFIYLSPRPPSERIDEYYQDPGYDPFLSIQEPQRFLERLYELARRFTLTWKKRIVRQLVPYGVDILDVGCGTGEFLAVLQPDFNVEGIEPEPRAAQWARERFGFKVHTGNPESADLPAGKFRLISLWHVLEHVPEPVSTLRLLTNALAEKGRILIAAPNIRSVDAKIYGSSWVAIDAPRHLWHFSKPQLEHLALKSGLKLTGSGMLPLDTFYNVLHSELLCRQIKGASQVVLMPFRMTIALLASLTWGLFSGQHSGRYYIFDKT